MITKVNKDGLIFDMRYPITHKADLRIYICSGKCFTLTLLI